MKYAIPFILCSGMALLFGEAAPVDKKPQVDPYDLEYPAPWFTGPLIAPPPEVVPQGRFTVETYFTWSFVTGEYNEQWQDYSLPLFQSISLEFLTIIGITEWMDFQITPTLVYNMIKQVSTFGLGDVPIGLDFQLINAKKFDYFPGVKVYIREILPLGEFEDLNPDKYFTDSAGGGSWATNTGIVLYKEFHFGGDHYLATEFNFDYTHHSPVDVKGFNAYGGGIGTNGTVYIGDTYEWIASFEYSFSKHWGFSFDAVWRHENRAPFKGDPGVLPVILPYGFIIYVPAMKSLPSSEQISFAPAIEYMPHGDLAVTFGCFLSGFGRNSPKFRAAMMNVEYRY